MSDEIVIAAVTNESSHRYVPAIKALIEAYYLDLHPLIDRDMFLIDVGNSSMRTRDEKYCSSMETALSPFYNGNQYNLPYNYVNLEDERKRIALRSALPQVLAEYNIDKRNNEAERKFHAIGVDVDKIRETYGIKIREEKPVEKDDKPEREQYIPKWMDQLYNDITFYHMANGKTQGDAENIGRNVDWDAAVHSGFTTFQEAVEHVERQDRYENLYSALDAWDRYSDTAIEEMERVLQERGKVPKDLAERIISIFNMEEAEGLRQRRYVFWSAINEEVLRGLFRARAPGLVRDMASYPSLNEMRNYRKRNYRKKIDGNLKAKPFTIQEFLTHYSEKENEYTGDVAEYEARKSAITETSGYDGRESEIPGATMQLNLALWRALERSDSGTWKELGIDENTVNGLEAIEYKERVLGEAERIILETYIDECNERRDKTIKDMSGTEYSALGWTSQDRDMCLEIGLGIQRNLDKVFSDGGDYRDMYFGADNRRRTGDGLTILEDVRELLEDKIVGKTINQQSHYYYSVPFNTLLIFLSDVARSGGQRSTNELNLIIPKINVTIKHLYETYASPGLVAAVKYLSKEQYKDNLSRLVEKYAQEE